MGGQGSNGGGGGSGGRLIVNLLNSYKSSSQPEQSGNWWGKYNIDGGEAGSTLSKYVQASAGDNGAAYSQKCMPGYTGVFCHICPVGTFKSDYSYGVCLLCENKPVNAFYDKEGETSSLCSY